MAGDDRDGQRVAGGHLGVLAGEVGGARVGGLAERGPEPGVLQVGRAGHLAELADGDVHDHLGVGAGPVGGQPGAEQQVARLGQGVVEPLPLVPVVFWALLLA